MPNGKELPTFVVTQARKGRGRTKPLWWAHVMRHGRRIVTGAGTDANHAIVDAKRQMARRKKSTSRG